MTNPSSTIVQRLWKTFNVLRDDGMSYRTSSRLPHFHPAKERQSKGQKMGEEIAGRLWHIIPERDVSPSGEAALRSAFEGRLVNDYEMDKRTEADGRGEARAGEIKEGVLRETCSGERLS